jgi:two-component system phosphate regulon response regulator PhoB
MNSPSSSTTRKKRILLVDDEPFLTTLLRMNLEDTGEYEVREENHSLKTLDSIREFVPDLVILDVMMPDLDGADILFRLKNDENLKHVVVVFHTATSSQSGMIKGYPILAKPATTDQIIRFIEQNLPKPLVG